VNTKSRKSRITVPVWNKSKPNVLHFWLLIAKPFYKPIAVIFIAQTLAAISQVLMPFALSGVVQQVRISYQSSSLEWGLLFVFLLGFMIFSLSEFYFTRLVSNNQLHEGSNIRHTAITCLYNHLSKHSHRYITDRETGFLASKMNEASSAITNGLWIFLTELWPTILIVIFCTIALTNIHPALGFLLVLWTISFMLMAVTFSRKSYPLAKSKAFEKSKVSGYLNDVVSNLIAVKLFVAQQYELERFESNLKEETKKNTTYESKIENSRILLYCFSVFYRIISLLLAIWLISSQGMMASEFVLIILLTNVVINQTQIGSKRLDTFLNVNSDIDGAVSDLLQEHEIQETFAKIENKVVLGDIVFNNVSFSYDGKNNVLDRLNINVPACQRIGIVGVSGSGKSTLANLILRLYDVSKGNIFIDGIDIKNIPLSELYRKISVVSQSPSLFHRTIKENISYSKEVINNGEIIKVAQQGQCHDFVIKLPQGYDTIVGERGLKLSGGQRQRISIARAILKDAPIVILDEATSALDSITESEIQKSLESLLNGKTVISIAHRLSTIKDFDRILVLSEGRVVEDGSHEILLKKRGIYSKLWKQQLGSSLA
jgi:ATP-binding cassette subfamily B protein